MSDITLVVEDAQWREHRGLQARLKEAAQVAARAVRLKGEITILLADDARLKRLNHDFRGKRKATNVLSFPQAQGGDIAIAHGVVAREAKEQDKTVAAHALHLVVHGVLHLAGYDHIAPDEAKVMEPLEVKILKRLGIADPYMVAGGGK